MFAKGKRISLFPPRRASMVLRGFVKLVRFLLELYLKAFLNNKDELIKNLDLKSQFSKNLELIS